MNRKQAVLLALDCLGYVETHERNTRKYRVFDRNGDQILIGNIPPRFQFGPGGDGERGGPFGGG